MMKLNSVLSIQATPVASIPSVSISHPRVDHRLEAQVSNAELRSRETMASGIHTDWWRKWHWPSHLKRFS